MLCAVACEYKIKHFCTLVVKKENIHPSLWETIIQDIGVLASVDPIALDKATLDLIHKKTGQPFHESAYPNVDGSVQLKHGQEIGLGTMEYNFVEIE